MLRFSSMISKRLGAIALSAVLSVGTIAPIVAGAQTTIQTGITSRAIIRNHVQNPQAILQDLLNANKLPASTVTSIEMVETKELNAATDGKKIIVTRPLWDALVNNDRRAFVISHELAHITQRHVPETTARSVGQVIFSRLILDRVLPGTSTASTLLNQAANASLSLLNLRFSRSAELEADSAGLRLMANAGYNPQGAVETLQILEAKAPGGSTPEFLMNHPVNANRIRALATQYKQLQSAQR